MLRWRVLSALVGIPFFLWAVYQGGPVYIFLVGTLILLIELEFYSMMRIRGIIVDRVVAIGGGLLFLVAAVFVPRFFFGVAAFGVLILALGRQITRASTYDVIHTVMSFFAAVYGGGLISHLVVLRQLPDGQWYTFLLLASIWVSDSAAYFVGVKLGRHPLSPEVSPNKTLEGAAAGLAAGLVAVGVLASWMRLPLKLWFPLGLLIPTVGQFGDLVESLLKRYAGVKDSGSLIPGHGGVLDRFDALLFAAPLVYYYVAVFIIG